MDTIYSDEYKRFIHKLVAARKKARITQVEAAALLDKPQSYISKIETCQRRIDPIELKRLVKIYKLTNLSDLFK